MTLKSTAQQVKRLIWLYWLMACNLNVSKALQLMWPTVFLPRTNVSLLLLIPQGMSSTPEIWQPAGVHCCRAHAGPVVGRNQQSCELHGCCWGPDPVLPYDCFAPGNGDGGGKNLPPGSFVKGDCTFSSARYGLVANNTIANGGACHWFDQVSGCTSFFHVLLPPLRPSRIEGHIA